MIASEAQVWRNSCGLKPGIPIETAAGSKTRRNSPDVKELPRRGGTTSSSGEARPAVLVKISAAVDRCE